MLLWGRRSKLLSIFHWFLPLWTIWIFLRSLAIKRVHEHRTLLWQYAVCNRKKKNIMRKIQCPSRRWIPMHCRKSHKNESQREKTHGESSGWNHYLYLYILWLNEPVSDALPLKRCWHCHVANSSSIPYLQMAEHSIEGVYSDWRGWQNMTPTHERVNITTTAYGLQESTLFFFYWNEMMQFRCNTHRI